MHNNTNYHVTFLTSNIKKPEHIHKKKFRYSDAIDDGYTSMCNVDTRLYIIYLLDCYYL